MNYYNSETLLEQQNEIENLREQNAALSEQIEALRRDKAELLAYALDAEKWFNKHDPSGYVSPKREDVQHHLRNVKAQAVEWAMNKLKREYEAYPLLHYSTFAISQHIEAQSKQYAEQVLQGDIK